MIKYLIFIIGLMFGSALASDYPTLDSKNGFRDMLFGSSIDNTQGMILINDKDDIKIYRKKNDNTVIGQGEVEGIIYGYYKNKLLMISLHSEGFRNFENIFSVLKSAYGNPHQANEYIKYYTWFGEKVWLSAEYSDITKNVVFCFVSKEIKEELKKDQADEATKAVSGL